jgi:hypothetical protein
MDCISSTNCEQWVYKRLHFYESRLTIVEEIADLTRFVVSYMSFTLNTLYFQDFKLLDP